MRKGEMINHPITIIVKRYSPDNRALLIVDPFNDFLSEGSKLCSSMGNDTKCDQVSLHRFQTTATFLKR
jgi:hypothetical protein